MQRLVASHDLPGPFILKHCRAYLHQQDSCLTATSPTQIQRNPGRCVPATSYNRVFVVSANSVCMTPAVPYETCLVMWL